LNYSLQALDLYEELNNQEGKAKILNNIGNIYLYLNQYEKALQYYLNSVEVKKELNKPSDLISSYHNIALVYQQLDDFDEAKEYYNKTLELLNHQEDLYSLSVCYSNLAGLYSQFKDYKKAEYYNSRAYEINQNIDNQIGICSNLNEIARSRINLNQLDEVPDLLNKSLDIAIKKNITEAIATNCEVFSLYYEHINNLNKSLEYFKKFKTINDSINEETNRNFIAELGIQYETAQREKEIELLKKESEHQNQVNHFLIYGLVFGIVLLIFLFNLYYEKIKDGKIKQEMQEKLQENETLYRTLTHNLKSAVYTFDPEGKFMYVNKATCEITGYTEEELLTMRFFDVVHPDDRDMVSQRGLSRIRGEKVISNYEFKLITKGGEVKWTETSSTRVVISSRIMVLGTAIDISERHIVHEKLKASEAHLRALFAGMDEVIFVLDREGRYLSIAPTNPDLLFKPVKEVVGKTVDEIFEVDKAKFFKEKIRQCLKNQEMVPLDYQLTINNSEYWFGAKLTPLNKKNVLFIGRNITEERKSIQKLIESEEKYRNLVESIEEGMTIVDKNMNFVFVNNAACKIFGYSRTEMLRMNALDILPEENRELIREQHVLRMKGESSTYENWNIRKDGQLRLMKISSSPYIEKGEIISTISLFSDVTEIRESEEMIKASLREKEVMLQEIYHRVKNNMQIISSMLKLQSRYINKENALEVFKNSQNRVKSMSLIHEKLYRSNDLSRIDINDYLTSLIKQLFISYRANLTGIRYEIECDSVNINISTSIPCGLIVNELVTNAMKHAFRDRKEGLVRIKLKEISNKLYRLEIGNDGTAFPADFDIQNAPSFGLQLVEILRHQLHADFQIEHHNGVNFIFTFKELVK
jgi:PAS domain S-box-containing protein